MLQLYRFFRDETGLEQTDIYYQAHVLIGLTQRVDKLL